MFIEVDDRRTGKSTKLIEEAYNHLLSDDFAGCICIVAYKMQISKDLKNMILNKVKSDPTFNKSQYNHISKKILITTSMFDKILRTKHIDRFFVDEFDYLEYENFTLLNGSYYTTSINPNKSIVNNKIFIEYLLEIYPNLKRVFKIEKLFNNNISFFEMLNNKLNFNINKK